MSRFYVFLINVVIIAMTISVAITSERVNRGIDQIEKPAMSRISNIAFSQSQNVVPFTDSSSLFLLNLLKCKKKSQAVQYEKLDYISTTTAATTASCPFCIYCICVPYYLCSNITIINGTGINVLFQNCSGVNVCCYPPYIIRPTPPLITWTYPTVTYPTVTFPTVTLPTILPTVLPNCICVDVSLCDPNGIVSISGEGILNPRYGLCPGNLVCCRLLVNTTQPPTSMTTALPGQTQLCFVCGNITLCFTCNLIITPDGGSGIDPRFSQVLSQGKICSTRNVPSCENISSDDEPLTNLGPVKYSGTSQECYCVKTWQCSEGNVVSPDGLGIIDSRFTFCSLADQVCCRPAGISLRNADMTFESSSRRTVEPLDRLSSQNTCGIQNKNYAPSQASSSDSEKTYFAEFPWMVALLLKSATGSYALHCGASMVNNGAVLTAAHCVVNQKPENLIARFGQWNIGIAIQPLPIKEAKISAIAVHPMYYSGGLYHDVALLILTEPVTYSANILPICLPEQGMVFSTGTRCYGIGWSSSSFGSERQHQAELRKVNLPIVDREDCQRRLRSTKLGQHFELHRSFICAGGEGNRDTCRGDGGGPLICQASTGQFFQAGIVSWGIGCGASNVPAVYASVSQHRQWLDQQFATYGV